MNEALTGDSIPKLFAFILLSFILACPAQAVFSPVINTTETDVHYNITSTFGPAGSTPAWLFLVVAVLGIGMLGISICIKQNELPKDGALLISLISIIPLLTATWMSLSIDVIASYGSVQGMYIINNSTSMEYIMLEHHIIYNPLPVTIMFIILCGVSILNTLRIRAEQKILLGETDNGIED